MTHYEGILVTWNDIVNASAAGAEIDDSDILLNIYRPSDTADNLLKAERFTFSLTDDPDLFFKAALTGHDSDTRELEEGELVEDSPYIWPKEATRVYFCEVDEREELETSDEYGDARQLRIQGTIVEKRGGGPYIQREDPLVDAMVYASRLLVADEEQKEELKHRITHLLEDTKSDITKKIMDYVEERT